MPVSTSVFGAAGADTVTYTISSVAGNGLIQSSKIVDIATKINQERGRRGAANASLTTSGVINASDINAIKTAVEVSPLALGTGGYYDNKGYTTHSNYQDTSNVTQYFSQAGAYTGGFAGVSANSQIAAQNINDLISKLQNAGAVCMCNCNYCTCNCNYCTCNCNYACTCNCNYSDERLKDNIKLIDTKEGLNIYSFTYKWDNKKVYTGVMAQELVGTQYAGALGTDKAGYFYVDYSQLPITFEEV